MAWPTWQQGAITALVCGIVAFTVGRVRPAAKELSLMAGLYTLWRLARTLPLATDDGAIERARQIDDLQKWLHFPTELSLQHLSLDHEWLGRFLNYYYAILHVPVTVAFLVWMFVRHRDAYPHWRNGLAIVTGPVW